jgi:hypothetical protein
VLKKNKILSSLILRQFINCVGCTILNDSVIGKNDLQLHFFRNLACFWLLHGTPKKYSFNITALLCGVRWKCRQLTAPQQGPALAVSKIIILIKINGTGIHYLSWSVQKNTTITVILCGYDCTNFADFNNVKHGLNAFKSCIAACTDGVG